MRSVSRRSTVSQPWRTSEPWVGGSIPSRRAILIRALRRVILRLTPKTSELIGQTVAEWLAAGEAGSGGPRDNWKARRIAYALSLREFVARVGGPRSSSAALPQ